MFFLKKKLLWYLVIALILFFLSYHLIANWQIVKKYQFSFNYSYLAAASILLAVSMSSLSFLWRKILLIIEPQSRFSWFVAWKTYIYTGFGKYLPGNVWSVVGKVYLGQEYGFTKKNLFISSLLDGGISVIATLLIGSVLVFSSLGFFSPILYWSSLGIIIIGLIIIHPKIFYSLFNFILHLLKKEGLAPQQKLNYGNIIKILLYYCFVHGLHALAFLIFLKSFVSVHPTAVIGVLGAYPLSVGLGVAALFAPSGLGIREGAMSLILQFYFPSSIAILIAFLSRIWLTLIESFLFLIIYIYEQAQKLFKKNN